MMQADRQDLSLRARRIGTVVWASFLAACVGTMFFFAFIAPEELVGDDFTTTMIDHLGVYTLGFFGLWLVALLASALTLTMSQPPDGTPPEDRRTH
jgi:hypothetical protein